MRQRSLVTNFQRAMSSVRRTTIRIVLILTLPVLLISASPAQAVNQVPKMLNYQARLTDLAGSAVPDGSLSVTFKFYDGSGTCLFSVRGSCGTPTAKSVTVTGGVFSTLLGDMGSGDNEIPDTLFNNSSVFLGITIGADSEMTPRKRITPAAYALNADRLDGLDVTDSGSTTPYIVATNSNGNLMITGDPQGSGVANGSFYVNPATAASNETLLGIASNGSSRFVIDREGDITHNGSLLATAASSTAQFIFRGASAQANNIFETQDEFGNRLLSVSATSTRFVNRFIAPAHATNQGLQLPTFAGAPSAVTGTAEGDVVWDSTGDALYVYNGTAFTSLSGTTPSMLQTYNASTSTTEIFITPTQGALTIADTFSGTGNIFEVQDRTNSAGDFSVRYLTVSATSTHIAGDLLPGSDNVFDLGSTASRWKTLHVGPGSIVVHNDATNTLKATLGFSGATAQLITDAATPLQITTGNNTGLRITTGGLFGIGNAAPANLLAVGSSTSTFEVDASGNLIKINNVPYSWPAAQGGTNTVLFNNGSGTLSWTVATGIVNFNQAYLNSTSTTELFVTPTQGALTIADTFSGTGNIFEIQNRTNSAGDFSTRYLTVSSTSTNLTYDSLTSGIALNVASSAAFSGNMLALSATGNASGDIFKITSTGSSAANRAIVIDVDNGNTDSTLFSITSDETNVSTTAADTEKFSILESGSVLADGALTLLGTANIGDGTGSDDFTFTSAKTSGTIFRIVTAGNIATNTVASIAVTSNPVTTGNLFSSALTSPNVSAAQTGFLHDFTADRTFASAGTFNETGSILRTRRLLTSSNGSATVNASGDVVLLVSDGTQSTGTLNISGSVLELQQNYAAATGAALNIVNAGTAADIALPSSAIIDIGNGGSLLFRDGTNTLCSITDAGTTGNFACAGSAGFGTLTPTSTRFSVEDTSATFGTIMSATGTALTTGTLAKLIGGSALTTGSLLDLSGAAYTHTGTADGYVMKLDVVNNSNNSSGTSNARGLYISSTINNTSGAGSHFVRALEIDAPTFVCSDGACSYSAIRLATPAHTSSNAATKTLSAFNLNNAGALVQDTAGGSISWNGILLSMPDVTQTTGTVSAYGLRIFPSASVTGSTTVFPIEVVNAFRVDNSGNTLVNLTSANSNALCHPSTGAGSLEQITDCSGAPAADYMEMYPAANGLQMGDIVMPGDVTVSASGGAQVPQVVKTNAAYKGTMIGVISNPADAGDFNSIGHEIHPQDNPMPVALKGRVKVKVNFDNGSIKVGDPITSSATPGVGMKSTKPGMIIGQALEAWNGPGQGTVLVFMGNGFHSGLAITTDGAKSILADDFSFKPLATSSASGTSFSSYALRFDGSTWDGDSNIAVTRGISLRADMTSKNAYQLAFRNDAGLTIANLNQSGDLALAGSISVNGGLDYAETFPAAPDLDAGDIVMVDPENASGYGVKKSDAAYANALVGVISTKPGFLTGKPSSGSQPVALAGRVPAKISLENGEIKAGDPITSSSVPGVGMKATEPGRVIGIALEGWNTNAIGTITLFVNPSWWNGPAAAAGALTDNALSINPDALLDFKGSTFSRVASIVSSNGLWSISTDGHLIAERIEAKEANVQKLTLKASGPVDRTVGKARLQAGSTAMVVTNPHVTEQSIILITFESNPGSQWWISEKHEGSFVLTLAQPAIIETPFTYWIVPVDGTLEPIQPETNNGPTVSATDVAPVGVEEEPVPAPAAAEPESGTLETEPVDPPTEANSPTPDVTDLPL